MYNNNNNNSNRYASGYGGGRGGSGGGGGGGDYSRKRKNEDDGYIQYYKKPKPYEDDEVEEEVEPQDELEALIFKLGDKNDVALDLRLESLSGMIDAKMASRKDEIQHLLYECISKLPEKYTVYATLLGLINIKNYNFVVEFIEKIAKNLKEVLRAGNFFVGYRLIRFIANLVNVNVITAKSLFEMFEQFLALTTETPAIQARTDFYVYVTMSSLPYCGKELYEKHGPQFDDLMHSIETYINKRRKEYLPLLKVWNTDEPHAQEEYIDCLWIQIKKLEENEWNEKIMYRPYKKFEVVLSTSLTHDLPLIVPPEHHEKISYPPPRVIFRMFDYTDVPEELILPGAHSIDRFLVEDQIHLILDTYFLERKICAQQLLNVQFANKMAMHYIIVEVIFAQLLTLPKATHIEIFYGSLLIELCRLESTILPQILAQATELMFDRLDHMKASCIERFAKWFSYHLSNFQFRWSWDDWKACLDEDIESPKCKFIREVLLNCMRLSYHQRIVEMLPENMQALTPAAPLPFYKYESEDAVNLEGTAMASKILELMKNRCIPEDILGALRDEPDKEANEEMEADNKKEDTGFECDSLKIDVFTSTLLFFGSKSLSHVFAALAKFHMLFKTIVEDEESQAVVLKSLHEVWKNHQQMTVIMVDKMLKTQIVECSSIANWIFSKELRSDLTSFYVWEILNSTVNRMNIQVDKLQNDYNECEENYKKNQNNLSLENTQEDLENELKMKLEHLKILKEQQHELFFIVFKHFIDVINEYNEKPAEEQNKHWHKWIIERFQDFLLRNNDELYPYYGELKSEFLSSGTVDSSIHDAFQMFYTMKC